MQVSNEIKRLGSGLRVGQHKRTCPECQGTRTKNRKDKPLSIKVDAEGVQYMCHHCGTEGGWMHNNSTIGVTDYRREPRMQSKPIVIEKKTVNEVALAYLRDRKISDEVIEKHTVCSEYRFNGTVTPAVGFLYTKGDTIEAAKWRSADGKKHFSQENVCTDFFNLDSYVDGNDILICEGEMDALAWMSCDLPENLTVLSIPNGAPAGVKDGKIDPKDDKKFGYIWRAERQLATAGRVLLNTDNDGPGTALQKEIIRRIGGSKAWVISLGEYKDALLNHV